EFNATDDAHIVVFIGKPFDEPVVRHGPFAMTNQNDINRAIADYQAGRMGSLT
ncbi:MAG: pirin-like C-terminal cupin domain-containing protein, partial [Casimicrobium sp.]